MTPTIIADASIDILKSCKREIKNGSRVHFYHGAADLTVKILLEKGSLEGGESAFCQLHFDRPICFKPMDKFVLRFLSPLETVGGGIILHPNAKKIKKLDQVQLKRMEVLKSGGLSDKIVQFVTDCGKDFPLLDKIKFKYLDNLDEFDGAVKKLLETKRLFEVGGMNKVTSADFLTELGKAAVLFLKKYHTANPLALACPKPVLKTAILRAADMLVFDKVLACLCALKLIKQTDEGVLNPEFFVLLSPAQQKISDHIARELRNGGFSPKSLDEIFATSPTKDKKGFNQVFDALVKSGGAVLFADQIAFDGGFYKRALSIFEELAKKSDPCQVSLGQFRDALGTSRKFALAVLEYFDKRKITKQVGEFRVLV